MSLVLAALIVCLSTGCGSDPPSPQPAATTAAAPASKKAFEFKGKVEAVDPAGKTLTVTNENIDGWMAAMTMMYKADKDDVYTKVKPGDQISARVYDGILDMLYDVQVISTDRTEPAAK
jgi:Cu/Ag efflux protein CusF